MKEDSSAFDDILNENDTATDEVVETPVADTPAAEAEVVEEVVQPEIPEGYKQDERGVWHRSDGTIASKDEVAKFGKQSSAEGGAAIPAPGEVATPPAPAEPPKPWSYKALGAEHALEGATLDANGNVVISKDALPAIQGMLARAQEFPTVQSREARLNNEVAQHRTNIRELSTRAEKAEFAYQHLAAILDDPERLAGFLTDPREKDFALRELQLGMKNAEIARATADRASQAQAQTAEQSTAQEVETITNAIDLVAKSPELQPLAAFITPEDLEDAKSYFKEMRGAIVKTAEDDSLRAYGISKGEKYVTHQPMIQYLSRIAAERKKAKDALEAATKANKFNVAQTPKVVPPKKAPAPVAAGKSKKDTKDWDSSFKGAWNAEDDED